ncbi:MAG: T9SS type A sorting domain-containing protein, partial [Saprospiraceae bacterium]
QYSNDRAGTSVSLSADGTRVAIGAPQNNPGVGSNLGQVRVYQESGGIWTQIGADIIGEASGNFSGRAVSLSSDGTYLAIGAPNNGGNGANSGHVRIYQISGGTWTQVGPDIDGEASGDYSGGSVSLSSNGARVAIGATTNAGNGTNSGHVRIYEMSGGSWTQVGTDIDGAAAYDNSGSSVSLSDDGTLLVIGAHYNDANGANSGHVRIYEESGGTWTQTGIDINGEAAANYSGSSVAVSSDGTHIAIGAFGNAENGTNSGHVRVFSNLSLPVELLFFKGELQEKEILLSWKTATEENNEGFQVEQSDDGINWKEITFVKGNGTSAEVHNYQYLDSDPVMGINHYRLKQTDYDGSVEYSKIISIHWKVKGISIGEFYPNPSFSKLVYLSCYSATDGELSITVLDINGRELTKEIRQISNGTNNLEFNLTDLNEGIYFIKIENRQNISYQQVILE